MLELATKPGLLGSRSSLGWSFPGHNLLHSTLGLEKFWFFFFKDPLTFYLHLIDLSHQPPHVFPSNPTHLNLPRLLIP